jgi:MFS transporter, DHA1 family, multidrug resistance protein
VLKKDSLAFTLLLSGLVAMPPLSTDFGLAAYGATATALRTSESSIALTLSFFMLGFAVGPFAYGPLSGRMGRKPVLVVGLVLYFVTSLLCTLTSSLWLLLAGRLFQGFAASAGTVLAVACIRDLFDGLTGRKKMSWVMIINGIMPLTAPTLGVMTLALGDWRTIYAMMTLGGAALLLGVLFGLPETLREKNPNPLSPRQLIRDYGEVFRHPLAIRAVLINAAGFGMMFAYISGSPLLFISAMHVSQSLYGLLFAVPVLGSMAGTLIYNRLLGTGMATRRILHLSLTIMLGVTLLLLLLLACGRLWLVPIVTLLTLSNLSMGMTGPNVGYTAVQFLPHLTGEASALLTGFQMTAASLSASLVAALFGWLGPAALAVVMFGFSLIAWLIHASTRPIPAAISHNDFG